MTEPKRDQYGRYIIDGQSHTRVTSVADVLDDRFHLERWQQRNVALGLAKRPDLLALAQSSTPQDKTTLNRVCKEAIDAVAAGARSNVGTALHRFLERIDGGEVLDVPGPHSADVKAYRECLRKHRIDINPDWIEVVAVCETGNTSPIVNPNRLRGVEVVIGDEVYLCHPDNVTFFYKADDSGEPVAGTIDRILRYQDDWVIGDIKSGKSMDFAWRKTAIQLALYSRAKHLYNPATEELTPMPPVNQDHAIVFHLPAGEGKCTPYRIDLQAGWEAAQLSLAARAWRKRDDLATPLEAT